MATKLIKLELPAYHANQQKIYDNRRAVNIVCCGRRWGKTVSALITLTKEGGILHGMPCAWFAPKNKYMAKVWREIIEIMKPVIVRTNATERVIEFVGGGELEFWTLEDPDAGKSRKYARAVVDEAALVKDLQYSWEQAIGPTLTDFQGDAWFLSTPQGYDFFYELWERGAKHLLEDPNNDPYPEYISWQMPTSSNPTIKGLGPYLARMERELPTLVYQQEYLAQFVDFGGTLIEKAWIRYGVPNPEEVVSTCIGVDLAISIKEDACYTAFVVLQNDIHGNIYLMDSLKEQLRFHEVITELTAMADKWKARGTNPRINIEEVAYQTAVVQEMLRKTKLNVHGVRPEANKDKLIRFLPLQPRYKNGLIYHNPRLARYVERDILAFPNGADLDIPDAMVYAFKGLRNMVDDVVASTGRRDSSHDTRHAQHTNAGTWGGVSEY